MSKVILRWPARKWEKAPLMCRLFGHIWRDGWFGDRPYLRPSAGPVDNIGRHHVSLSCKCDRCGRKSTIAYVHDWAEGDQRLRNNPPATL